MSPPFHCSQKREGASRAGPLIGSLIALGSLHGNPADWLVTASPLSRGEPAELLPLTPWLPSLASVPLQDEGMGRRNAGKGIATPSSGTARSQAWLCRKAQPGRVVVLALRREEKKTNVGSSSALAKPFILPRDSGAQKCRQEREEGASPLAPGDQSTESRGRKSPSFNATLLPPLQSPVKSRGNLCTRTPPSVVIHPGSSDRRRHRLGPPQSTWGGYAAFPAASSFSPALRRDCHPRSQRRSRGWRCPGARRE